MFCIVDWIGLALVGIGGASQYFFSNTCQEVHKLSLGYIAIIVGGIIVVLVLINMGIQCSGKSTGGCGMVMVGLTFVIILGAGGALIFAAIKKDIVTFSHSPPTSITTHL